MNSGTRHHDVRGGRGLPVLMRSRLWHPPSISPHPQHLTICKISQRLGRLDQDAGPFFQIQVRGAGKNSVRVVGKMRKVCGDFPRDLAAQRRV